MIKPLTSLRFFFAFCVFTSHLPHFAKHGIVKFIYERVFFEGFLGVSFFFILSGFILALNYKNKFLNNSVSIKSFYIARFARIYPLHLFTLLLSVPLFFKSLKIMGLNLLLLQSYFSDMNIFFSYNAPSWSISDEFFFYALFPVLIFITTRLSTLHKVISFTIIALTIIFLNVFLPEGKTHYWLYISPFTRIFDFIIGIFLYDMCLYFKKHNINLKENLVNLIEISSIAILILFFIFSRYIPLSYRFSIYYWIPMSIIILAFARHFTTQNKKSILTTFLSKKWIVYLGEISFAFYLLHYQVLAALFKFNNSFSSPISNFLMVIIVFIVTILASIFAFEKIEKPLNKKIKNHFA